MINETGEYVTPILSGHLVQTARPTNWRLLGRNKLLLLLQILTAFFIDVWTKENGLHI